MARSREADRQHASPFETRELAVEHPEIVADLKRRYDQWFDDVGSTRPDNYAPLHILLGTPHENPVVLTRQDWRGIVPGKKFNGYWLVNVTEAGNYDVTLRFKPISQPATAYFELGAVKAEQSVREGGETVFFRNVSLPSGCGEIEAWLDTNSQKIGVMFVEVLRRR